MRIERDVKNNHILEDGKANPTFDWCAKIGLEAPKGK